MVAIITEVPCFIGAGEKDLKLNAHAHFNDDEAASLSTH
jgi:hypothetical protein